MKEFARMVAARTDHVHLALNDYEDDRWIIEVESDLYDIAGSWFTDVPVFEDVGGEAQRVESALVEAGVTVFRDQMEWAEFLEVGEYHPEGE